jgi:glutamyl-tRNA reductase
MRARPAGRRAVLVVQSGPADRREAEALSTSLAQVLPGEWRVHTAGPTDLPPTLDRIASETVEELVVLPVHPHFSRATSGTAVRRLFRLLAARTYDFPVAIRTTWCDDAGYLSALARWVAEHVASGGARGCGERLEFVADVPSTGDPTRRDPYVRQLRHTAECVAELLDWPTDQVRVEPRPPDGSPGAEHPALVCALPFPSGSSGSATNGANATSAFLSYAPFLAALRGVVLHGSQPAPPRKGSLRPLLERGADGCGAHARPGDDRPSTLLLIGAALPGPLGPGDGPSFRYSEPDAFVGVKPSHKSLRAFLEGVRDEPCALETLVWNTCQRIECYLWVPDAAGTEEREGLIRHVRERLFGGGSRGLELNVLAGPEARHHLLRTACGLNSDLPGDRDVVAQLETALRTACSARTAGPRTVGLVEEAAALAEELRRATSWGVIGVGYCAAAVARVSEAEGVAPDELRHVVIGGSTTSRSILTALREDHGVPEVRLTAVYRDHHGQMKELRAAVGGGRRLRVHAYTDERVLSAIARADMVYFGIDQMDPVLAASALEGLRDFTQRRLTILDFNSFGSLGGSTSFPTGMSVWSAKDLDQAVATRTAILTAHRDFSRAVAEAEEHITGRLAAAVSSERPC